MIALVPGCLILAGRLPHLCRPATAYRVRLVSERAVLVEVVYSPGSPKLLGWGIGWPREQIEASWRAGDVRVVARWQEPAETLRQSLQRRMLDEDVTPATGQAAIAAGG
jgi:hypothetical protein